MSKINSRAILVAKDVIKQIEHYSVCEGSYINVCIPNTTYDKIKPIDLRDLIPTLKKARICKVCALGACLISKAKLFDNVPLEGMFKDSNITNSKYLLCNNKIHSLLQEIFPNQQAELIEAAFERSDNYGGNNSSENIIKAVDFGNNFDFPKERLIAIMQNIIDNRGFFIP